MAYQAASPPPVRTMREGLHQAKSFSPRSLLLTLAGATIGTAVPAFAGQGPVQTLGGTLVLSLLTAFGVTGADGTARGVKAAAALILALGAAAITVSGVTLADVVRGESVAGDRQKTFPVAPNADQPPTNAAELRPPVTNSTKTTNPRSGPAIEITSAVDCGSPQPGSDEACAPIVVRSTGTEPLRVTSWEFERDHQDEFSVDHTDCSFDVDLANDATCTIWLRFEPAGDKRRAVEFVVHQNLPGPASTVSVTGGSGSSGESEPPSGPTSVIPTDS
jgi:hypothetical protein